MNATLLAAILAACHLHPTPPPQRYINAAVAALPYITPEIIQTVDPNAVCVRLTGLSHPIGFPGRAFGACSFGDTRAHIVIPTGNLSAACHELGHLGGWPYDHPRR